LLQSLPTSALDECEWSTSRSGLMLPGKNPGSHLVGVWVGPRTTLSYKGHDFQKRKNLLNVKYVS
jgi:hypothetical protein